MNANQTANKSKKVSGAGERIKEKGEDLSTTNLLPTSSFLLFIE
jgi:hypothetical protein